MLADISHRLTALGTAVIAAVTLLALFAEHWWIAELFSHFRMQYVAAGLVLLLANLACRRQRALLAVLATMVANVLATQPFPLLPSAGAGAMPIRIARAGSLRAADRAPDAASGMDTLTIVNANVRARNADPRGLIELVRTETPDLLLIVEHTPAFEAAIDALRDTYPYRLSAPSEGPFGIALYSRLPLLDGAVFPLGATNAVRASIATASGRIDFVGVHLLPPIGAARAAERNRQIGRLADAVAGTDADADADAGNATIVCGDFNLTPYSPYFAKLLETSRLSAIRRGHGLWWTWPAGFLPLGLPIDHCLAGDAIDVLDMEVLGDIGSDHYPLRIDITTGGDR